MASSVKNPLNILMKRSNFFVDFHCKFFLQNFAEFMDVYHSSNIGIYKEQKGASPFVGHLDVWLNGGLGGVTDLIARPHPSAVYFFASTILGQCL